MVQRKFTDRRTVPSMDPKRYAKFVAYLNAHNLWVKDDPQNKSYRIGWNKTPNEYYSFAYWQINQETPNVLAILTMVFHYTFPGTPTNSYRCPDCGCNTDAQVERGAIEGTTRCQECYDYHEETPPFVPTLEQITRAIAYWEDKKELALGNRELNWNERFTIPLASCDAHLNGYWALYARFAPTTTKSTP